MAAKRLETFDVVADVATGARARRFRGGSEARARRSRYVSRVSAGTRGRARVRGLLRTGLATSTASSDAFDALNTFGAIPRGARRAMDSEGGGRRETTPKTARERAQSPRRRARDGDGGALSACGDAELLISRGFGLGSAQVLSRLESCEGAGGCSRAYCEDERHDGRRPAHHQVASNLIADVREDYSVKSSGCFRVP